MVPCVRGAHMLEKHTRVDVLDDTQVTFTTQETLLSTGMAQPNPTLTLL